MRSRKPEWVDDGLLIHRNISVYVCDADDTQAGGYDVHLNVGDDDTFDHLMFDNTATLYNRSTLRESWDDAAEWLLETAGMMMELHDWILENVDTEECE